MGELSAHLKNLINCTLPLLYIGPASHVYLFSTCQCLPSTHNKDIIIPQPFHGDCSYKLAYSRNIPSGVFLPIPSCLTRVEKVWSTGSMLPEHTRFSPGTHRARAYLKGVRSLVLNLCHIFCLNGLILPSNYM